MRVPASVQTIYFETDNANMDYQGIGIEGYAAWRIDPAAPETAIKTLDFFDADDPTARTNDELRTICVEAVRHVIANMSIDDALKKKDEIAQDLLVQLRAIEKKWGIIFDQVGIEKVRIMSATLFQQMQSQYRDGLRLEVEKARIATDRDIARETNQMREATQLESQETEKKLSLNKVDADSRVEESSQAERFRLQEAERQLNEAAYRQEAIFRAEKLAKDHELAQQERQLQREAAESEAGLLEIQTSVARLQADIERGRLEIEELRRHLEQSYSGESLTKELINALPKLYQAVKIENYSVMDSGGNGLSPAGRFLGELVHLLRSSGLQDLLKPEQTGTLEPVDTELSPPAGPPKR
jgi:hypothetical protein